MTESEKSEEMPATEDSRELSDDELDPVTGGALRKTTIAKTPTPGGPLPIPYPNVVTED